MTTKSNWDSLLTGSINGHEVNQTRTANVWTMGAPTVDLWVNSWNTIYSSDTLYTRYIDTEDVDNHNFYATGYAVSDTTPITRTKEVDLAGKSGYNNTLYFPHKTTDDPYWVFGYWLASPAASNNECVVNVEYDGLIYYNGFGDAWDFAFRPVICLPTSIVNQ